MPLTCNLTLTVVRLLRVRVLIRVVSDRTDVCCGKRVLAPVLRGGRDGRGGMVRHGSMCRVN